jgi:hypothetical protein
MLAAFAALGLDARFVALAVPPPVLATVLRLAAGHPRRGVTIPHKEAVVGRAPGWSRRPIGSARSTAGLRRWRIVGHNTDAGGFVDSLAEPASRAPAGAVVLSSGGARAATTPAWSRRRRRGQVVARRRRRSRGPAPSLAGDVLARRPRVDDVVSFSPAAEAQSSPRPLDTLPPTRSPSLVYHASHPSSSAPGRAASDRRRQACWSPGRPRLHAGSVSPPDRHDAQRTRINWAVALAVGLDHQRGARWRTPAASRP